MLSETAVLSLQPGVNKCRQKKQQKRILTWITEIEIRDNNSRDNSFVLLCLWDLALQLDTAAVAHCIEPSTVPHFQRISLFYAFARLSSPASVTTKFHTTNLHICTLHYCIISSVQTSLTTTGILTIKFIYIRQYTSTTVSYDLKGNCRTGGK